ncbi:MAG: pantothenate kinase [Legionellaceae bacterium]|mgnify:CR=1 FL=1|nr:pantothenate kinase [Legionellaceae bacterium]
MILCLDVGNSQIFGGVFEGAAIKLKFRYESNQTSTSDQLGLFLKGVLKENGIDTKKIQHIAISSVVPGLDYSLGSACIKYFNIEPFFLQPGVKTGLKIKTSHPNEVGSDLIASAIAGSAKFPHQNLMIIDFGTATTYIAISKQKEFLGAIIQAGIRVSMEALQTNAAKLPPVRIIKPEHALGKNTIHSIQSGLYYGQLGAIKEVITHVKRDVFKDDKLVVVGTGGFSTLFDREKLFNSIEPDLVLDGIRLALHYTLVSDLVKKT